MGSHGIRTCLFMKAYDWHKTAGMIRCRLDYWPISKFSIPRSCKSDVKPHYDSDHSPIYAEIKHKNVQRKSGPGFGNQ